MKINATNLFFHHLYFKNYLYEKNCFNNDHFYST